MAAQAEGPGTPGHIYTLHFDRPLGTTGRNSAQHYTGYAAWDVDARVEQHRHGSDAKIMRALEREGIGFQVVDVRPGGRDKERRMKHAGHHDRRCRVCHPERQKEADATPDRKESSRMATKTEPERVTQAQPAPPGTKHPDPVLADKGWHANQHSVWVRSQREPRRDADREAGQ